MSGALIAMSGGVDSSVAALLTVQQGYDCFGCMMKLFPNKETDKDRENICCTSADAEDAQNVAHKLGIPFHVFDFAETFTEQVINRFIQAYQNGETPNPCVDCNRYIKFGSLLNCARDLDKENIVTGHYARIEKDIGSGRYFLKKGVDPSKDQSYVLYTLTQEQLKHTLFPLGGMTKSRVREIALECGLVNAIKRDSQDICFVQNGGYADFVRQYTGREQPKGRFFDMDGKDLGENKGIIHYTVGQRKGLGLSAATPLYVCSVDAGNNAVVVGTEDNLFSKTLTARGINLIAVDKLEAAVRVRARIRYRQPEQSAVVWQLDQDTLRIEFDNPQRAITKGQAVVLYDGDTVIGGGTISTLRT